MFESAFTVRLPTVCPKICPTLALPTVAEVKPPTEATETAAPTAIAANPPPTARGVTLRFASASTVAPPPAWLIFAPLSTWANCVLLSVSTMTCAPSVTAPTAPPNAVPVVLPLNAARTFTASLAPEPAVTAAFDPM